MDFIITFFRDILDGPLYVVVAIISVVLICSCIGYLAEVSLNKKKEKKQYEESHATVGAVNQPVDNSGQVAVSNLNSIEVNSGVNNLPSSSVPEVLQQQQPQPQASFQQAGVVNQINSLPQQQVNVPPVSTPQPMPQVMPQQVQTPLQNMPQMPPIPNANVMGTAVSVPEVVNTVNNVGQQ